MSVQQVSDAGPRRAAAGPGGARSRRMPPRVRKSMLLTHVISAVGWLGVNVANLTLVLAALTTDDPETQRAALRAVGILAGTLLLPLALLAFLTGVLLSVGTQWGLLRYRWVLVKFVLTSIALVLIPLSLLPGVGDLVALVDSTPPGSPVALGITGTNLLVAGCVSTAMYVTCAVLSVFKPWGRTRRGARRAARQPA